MRQIIILKDEELDALRNNKMVQVNSRHIGTDIYLTTQKGFEIDLKNDEELEHRTVRSEDALKEIKETGHGCKTCKYGLKWLTEEPCSSCDIRLGNNKWEPEDGEDGDK